MRQRTSDDKKYTDELYEVVKYVSGPCGPMGDWLDADRKQGLLYSQMESIFDDRFFDLFDYPDTWHGDRWLNELDFISAIIWNSFPNLFHEFLQSNPDHKIQKRLDLIRKIKDEYFVD